MVGAVGHGGTRWDLGLHGAHRLLLSKISLNWPQPIDVQPGAAGPRCPGVTCRAHVVWQHGGTCPWSSLRGVRTLTVPVPPPWSLDFEGLVVINKDV